MIKYAIFINVLLLLDRPLYHCTMMAFCVTSLSLCLKVCFAWCKYSYPNFLLVSICIENLFPFLLFQSLCVLTSKVRIDGLPPRPHSATLCLLTGKLVLLHLKQLFISMCLLTFGPLFSDCFVISLFLSSSLPLFLCDLMIFCSDMFKIPFSVSFVYPGVLGRNG